MMVGLVGFGPSCWGTPPLNPLGLSPGRAQAVGIARFLFLHSSPSRAISPSSPHHVVVLNSRWLRREEEEEEKRQQPHRRAPLQICCISAGQVGGPACQPLPDIIIEKTTVPVRTAKAWEHVARLTQEATPSGSSATPSASQRGVCKYIRHWVPREQILRTNLWNPELSKTTR